MTVAWDGGASDLVSSTSDTSIVVTAPAGTGGRLYAIGGCVDARTITPPSGWTEVFNNTDGTNRTYLWMRADDAAGSYTFTVSGVFCSAGVSVHRLSGASTNTPGYNHATGPNDTSQTCPTHTTPTTNCLIFWCIYRPAAASGPYSASKGTERIDAKDTSGDVSLAVFTNLEPTAGAITGAVITSTGFGAKRMVSFSVESAAAGGFQSAWARNSNSMVI